MTAPTPIIMPSMVNAERRRLARIPCQAMTKFSLFMPFASQRPERSARQPRRKKPGLGENGTLGG